MLEIFSNCSQWTVERPAVRIQWLTIVCLEESFWILFDQSTDLWSALDLPSPAIIISTMINKHQHQTIRWIRQGFPFPECPLVGVKEVALCDLLYPSWRTFWERIAFSKPSDGLMLVLATDILPPFDFRLYYLSSWLAHLFQIFVSSIFYCYIVAPLIYH